MDHSGVNPGGPSGAFRLHARRSVLRLVERDATRDDARAIGRAEDARLNTESEARRAAAVARANRAAGAAELDDERLLFASRVARSLEGGRAACLPPEKRSALVAAAIDEGLRPFDANLIIAIVQDSARRGVTHSTTCLKMIAPAPVQGARRAWRPALATLLLAAALLAGLIALVRA